uniref:Uncharacterized protein n=1 Tax=Setaria viridis TaxID=4556 RepID=A0A4U6T159_SETVI|nr:hypothetical protein SEVIR_9G352500v2 [Setaria viridis]
MVPVLIHNGKPICETHIIVHVMPWTMAETFRGGAPDPARAGHPRPDPAIQVPRAVPSSFRRTRGNGGAAVSPTTRGTRRRPLAAPGVSAGPAPPESGGPAR